MNVRILSKDNQSLAQENAVLRNEVNTLKEQLALLQEQFDWLKKQVFGRKTEQTSVIMDDCTQLPLFPAEMKQAVSVPEKTITVSEHQHKAKLLFSGVSRTYYLSINEHIQHFAQIIATVQALQALISVGFVRKKNLLLCNMTSRAHL